MNPKLCHGLRVIPWFALVCLGLPTCCRLGRAVVLCVGVHKMDVGCRACQAAESELSGADNV